LDYPYLVACVYLASQPWVGGLSSSIPLLLGTENNFMIQSGVLKSTISVSYTLGSLLNAMYLLAFFIGMPLIMWWMRPKASEVRSMKDLTESNYQEQATVKEEAESSNLTGKTVSDRLNNSALIQLLVVAMALIIIGRHFLIKSQGLNLNIMIFIFMAIGLALHATPMRFVVAMKRACSNISGIIYQYPFYGGIMGIMIYTGLGSSLSGWLASHATIHTFPVIAQLTAATINFAIPSAGGEWAVVGPAFIEAAKSVTASLTPDQAQAFIARIAMSVAYGESSSNLLQPFFILIILPVMGAGVRVRARDVMGYLIFPFLYITLAIGLLVSFLPL
jgi:short-chain fatty acids transporter